MTSLQNSERTLKIIELGDLTLYGVYKEVFALFGYSKIGKTTSSHYLCNSQLESADKLGQLEWKHSGEKYKTALIGHSYDSQTQIPNLFPTYLKIGDKKIDVTVVDMPGYGDTFGFLRLYSNSYFLYRSFSKMESMKFIITFDHPQLVKTDQDFKKTIFSFVDSFKNYEKEQSSILAASVFLITKVPQSKGEASTLENIINILTKFMNNVKGISPELQKIYTNMLSEMIKKKKIFILEKPKMIKQKTSPNDMLLQIHKATEFWTRQRKQNASTISMDKINFVCGDFMLEKVRAVKDSTFRNEFKFFSEFTISRIENFFLNLKSNSLVKVMKALQEDAVSSNLAQASYIEIVKSFVKENYIFIEVNKQIIKSRQTATKFLFDKSTATSSDPSSEIQFFIKKIKFLQFVRNLSYGISLAGFARNEQGFEQISDIFKGFFRQFKRISPRPEDTAVILKYCYLMQRVIEESKITSITIYDRTDRYEQFQHFIPNFKVQDISIKITDVFAALSEIEVDSTKNKFFINVDITKIVPICHSTIDFFNPNQKRKENNIKAGNPQQVIIAKKLNLKDRITRTLKFGEILCRFTEQIREQALDYGEYERQGKYILTNLLDCRDLLCELHIEERTRIESLPNKQVSKDEKVIVDSIVGVTKAAGSILTRLNKYSLARDLFESVGCVSDVFEVFDIQLDVLKSSKEDSKREYVNTLREAGDYAKSKMQIAQAMGYFQKAYSATTTFDSREEINTLMIESTHNCTESIKDYRDKLEQRRHYQDIPKRALTLLNTILLELEKKIEKMNSQKE